MKKNWISKLALAALLLCGAGQAQAQKGYDVPALNPELQTMADQVIEMQISEPDKANRAFTKLMSKAKKKKEDLLSLGQYFLDKNIYPCAMQCAKQVYEADPTYIPGLMFNGEVCMMRKDYGSAGQMFDAVLVQDSAYVPALKRNAFVYKNVNPHVAIEMLQRIQRAEPDNHVASRDLGDIYYALDEYKDAVKQYSNYFSKVTENDSTDIRPGENYVQSLFATAEFYDIPELCDRFSKLDSKTIVFKRMNFFAQVENLKADQARAAMSYITENQYADSIYIYLDYIYATNFLADEGDIPGAITYCEKAVARDTSKIGALKQLASLYRRNKQSDKGIETFKLYLQKMGPKADLSDKLLLGQQYLGASQQADITPEHRAELVKQADELFLAILAERPDAYQAVLMRAALHITDGSKPEEEPKMLYEEALRMMEGKENTDNAKLTALRYLAFYHVQKDELDDARKCCDGILAIDAENAFAKQIDTYLKSQNK